MFSFTKCREFVTTHSIDLGGSYQRCHVPKQLISFIAYAISKMVCNLMYERFLISLSLKFKKK